jgi:hypothetical protein
MRKSKIKPTKFTAGSEARRRARELAGPPPAARVIPDKRMKPPKHKKILIEDKVGRASACLVLFFGDSKIQTQRG